MARILQTPSIVAIAPFDPSNSYSIEFVYNDNQAVKNRVIIVDNGTGMIIYDNTQSTMRLSHVIPANTLTPGKQYLVHLQVFDVDGNYSYFSDSIMFYCYSTPIFMFNGLTDGMTHKNATITLNLNYVQFENETLKSFQFFKYSSDKTLISSSDIEYSSTIGSHTFYGLNNNTLYYFRAIGETAHGIKLDTGYVGVNTNFELIPANILFELENNYKEGYINIVSNVNNVDYETENDNYTFEDGMLILNDCYVNYNDGLMISGDFSLFIEAKRLPIGTFLQTDDGNIALSIIEVADKYYCELSVKDSNYRLYSSLPNEYYDKLIVFELKRKGYDYNLKTYCR